MRQTILELCQLSVGYFGPRKSKHVVSSGIDLSLARGELVCLLGPNGAGKSTLLRTVAAIQRPLAGQVLLSGRDIHAIGKTDLARQLSVVLTERVAVGLLTAYEMVTFGRLPYTGWSGALREQDHAIVEASIQAVDAVSLARRYIGELSDGERQKIMLERALAQQPELMVLDEITAFLDLPRRVEIMRILRSLAHNHGSTILLSTHDLDLAMATADRIWLLSNGGAISAGAPEDLVLRGMFAAVFASEGVHFDEEAGSFAMHRTFSGDMALTGEGNPARWTRRARAGGIKGKNRPGAVRYPCDRHRRGGSHNLGPLSKWVRSEPRFDRRIACGNQDWGGSKRLLRRKPAISKPRLEPRRRPGSDR